MKIESARNGKSWDEIESDSNQVSELDYLPIYYDYLPIYYVIYPVNNICK